MIEKIKSVIGSIRFWMITLGSASAYIAFVETSGFTWSSLLNAIAIWIGVITGVGTADSIATKFGIKK